MFKVYSSINTYIPLKLTIHLIFQFLFYVFKKDQISFVFLFAGGYKGYGLGFMVELFCGIMSGSAFGPHVRSWNKSDVDADLVCIVHAFCIVHDVL